MTPGKHIIYLDKFSNREHEYEILDVFESFLLTRNVKNGKIRHIYREFYKNIKEVK